MSEALAAARTELEGGPSSDASPAEPAVEANVPDTSEQASTPTQEQPAADVDGFSEEATELAASLMDTNGESQNGSGSGLVPGSDDFWNTDVEVKTVNGLETVTLRELSDGFLRQADYTQKTQHLAELKKDNDEATEFLKAFKEDPAGFARSLAVQAGWLDAGADPVKEIQVAKIPTQEEIDAKLAEMVDERVKNDPRVQTAEVQDAQARLNTEYDRLQAEYKIPLSPELRQSLTDEAIKTGNADIEGILTKRLVRSQQQQSRVGDTNLASTSRPGSPPASATTPSGEEPKAKPTMREAWQESKVAAAEQ